MCCMYLRMYTVDQKISYQIYHKSSKYCLTFNILLLAHSTIVREVWNSGGIFTDRFPEDFLRIMSEKFRKSVNVVEVMTKTWWLSYLTDFDSQCIFCVFIWVVFNAFAASLPPCTRWTAAHQLPTLLVVNILQPASQRKSIVPRYRLNSFGRRCFAVAGPSTWNSLSDSLRDPALSLNIFRRQLKTHFCCEILTRCT